MKTKKQRKYFKKQKIQHRHNKRLKFIPMSVATWYDFFVWTDLKGPRWRTRKRVREHERRVSFRSTPNHYYERGRVFQSILRQYAEKCIANDLPTLDYHYKYDVPSYTDYICNHTYPDGKSSVVFNEDGTYQCSLCGKKFCDGVFNNKYSVKEYHGLITMHKKDDLLSLATLENANKNYDSKTKVKEARVIQESEPMELRSERNNNEQEE